MANDIYPPDATSGIGKVRALVGDMVKKADPKDPAGVPEYTFSDTYISTYLELNNGNPRFAAADALDTMATNEVMILKKIRTESLQTDGPTVANSIRIHADHLRARAKQEIEALDAAESVEIVDFADPITTWDVFEYRKGGGGLWL